LVHKEKGGTMVAFWKKRGRSGKKKKNEPKRRKSRVQPEKEKKGTGQTEGGPLLLKKPEREVSKKARGKDDLRPTKLGEGGGENGQG